MDQLEAKAERVNAVLRQALNLAEAEGGLPDLARVDAEILREQLEGMVSAAIARKEIPWRGDIATAPDAELLGWLGFSDDEDGRTRFRDEAMAFISCIRHGRDLPHICSTYCPWEEGMEEFRTSAERDYFRADVEWHLGYMGRKGFESSIACAVALYVYCQRNSRVCVDALLDALDALQTRGGLFDDWDCPEIPISEAVKFIYDENQKTAKPGDDPYDFQFPVPASEQSPLPRGSLGQTAPSLPRRAAPVTTTNHTAVSPGARRRMARCGWLWRQVGR